MILRSITKISKKTLINQIAFQNSRFDKFLIFVRGILNKMANQDNRSYRTKLKESIEQNLPAQTDSRPKNMLEAEKMFQNNQQVVSQLEKGRLKRIDEILGTKTYFHEAAMYEQRLDSQNVILISKLHEKLQDNPRWQVDVLNPQMPKSTYGKTKRKYQKFLKHLKSYPGAQHDLFSIDNNKQLNKEQKETSKEMIEFLTQQALYTNLALSDLMLTIQSIQKQKVYVEKDDKLVDIEQQENEFIFNGQVYFKPSNLMSIYRIKSNKFTRELVSSIDRLTQAVQQNEGNIQQVISLDQIYECLKDYYYDERVSEYLKKIQNNELNYLFTHIEVSPDSKSAFFVIDLMNSNKQFVGLYKRLPSNGVQSSGIKSQNVVFNIRPQVCLRNNGELYCIQRNQQSMFVQLLKIKFNNSIDSKDNNKQKQSKDRLTIIRNEITNKNVNRQQILLYKCKPYNNLRIINNKMQFSSKNEQITSNNILLQELQLQSNCNNKVYLITHKPGCIALKDNQMQLITANSSNLQQLLQNLKENQKFQPPADWNYNQKSVLNKCFEVAGVGFVVVRYIQVKQNQGNYLKYGQYEHFAKYISLVPYATSKLNKPKQQNTNSKIESKNIAKIEEPKINQEKQNKMIVESTDKQFQNQLQIDIEQSPLKSGQDASEFVLNPQNELILFVCPPHQFISEVTLKHVSFSNIYLLINKSFQSVYDRNSLYVFPLRKNLTPYSIYINGHAIKIINNSIGSGDPNFLDLKVQAPFLPVCMRYTLWKKQLKQISSRKYYSENIVIKQREDGTQIIINLLSDEKFIKRNKSNDHESQPVILYLPSKNERLDQIIVQKLVKKGVIFVQIVSCRGMFNSNMINLVRGSKGLYQNFIQDITETLIFIKKYVNQHVAIYAQGPSSCFATMLLNIVASPQNQLFDGCVLHEGLYDLSYIDKQHEYFFGSDQKMFQKVNLYKFPIFNPSKSQQQTVQNIENSIKKINNTMLSSLSEDKREQSRKFVNKLRNMRKVKFQSVFLKQFDSKNQKDIYNLSYLYKVLIDSITLDYKEASTIKYQKLIDKGKARSRESLDKTELNKRNNDNDQNI